MSLPIEIYQEILIRADPETLRAVLDEEAKNKYKRISFILDD